ncbi:MAG TPA: cobyric acid synthase [Polyangiales bacterium]|nr:cobyric acid synthase [Polyangiales bacterium]
MSARCWMVFGTASDSGKSTLVAGLCRALSNHGLRVAPFKAQNMARNAYVCADGAEIGVAQAVQAFAARVTPSADHNPILLKPEPGLRSQLVVMGKSWGSASFREVLERRPQLLAAMTSALARLRESHELVIMEGAGSPAEVNLQDRDLPNLAAARAADAEILLVADIDRGGVFASVLGTLQLLPSDIRARVRGVIINKFRGELGLLQPGLDFLAAQSGVPVLGVLPYLPDLALPDEDSLALGRRRGRARASLDEIEIAVVDTPCLVNFEDVLPLEREPGVVLRLTAAPRELLEADLVVLPGSKSTLHDLAFVRERGLDRALVRRAELAAPVLGICGGAQILGRRIDDPDAVESSTPRAEALGLLPHISRYERPKRTEQVGGSLVFEPGAEAARVDGFLLHHGRMLDPAQPFLQLDGGVPEGSRNGPILATMLHRLFDHASARAALLRWLRARRGLPLAAAAQPEREDPYARLARELRAALDWPRVRTLVGL